MKFHIHKFLRKELRNFKVKNSGASLLLALGLSTLILGISYATTKLVSKSVARNQSIERSNQVFYAAESGIEAAFFHHNARGAGVDFVSETETTQDINHSNVHTDVHWQIFGRDNPVSGNLKENQTIQIPLFWDDSLDPSSPPNKNGKLSVIEDFTLSFQRKDSQGEEIVPSGFIFGSVDEKILIDWSLLGKSATGETQTFIPSNTLCNDVLLGFICNNEIFSEEIDSSDAISGKIYPSLTATTLHNFFHEIGREYFQLKFQPILKFEDLISGKEVASLPFTLKSSSTTKIPKSTYKISSKVSVGNYSRTIETIIPEKTTVGAFGYVILD
jgi:hypothetical protein